MNARTTVTKWCTYALVVMSVLFAVVGFMSNDRGAAQIASLTAVLAIFSWLLSECLETYLMHRDKSNWRQYPTIALGLFLLAVEVHLVHFGVEWLFPELDGPSFLWMPVDYLISAGFSTMTVFAKATFGFQYEPEEPETLEVQDSDLADALESIGGTTLAEIDLDRTLAA